MSDPQSPGEKWGAPWDPAAVGGPLSWSPVTWTSWALCVLFLPKQEEMLLKNWNIFRGFFLCTRDLQESNCIPTFTEHVDWPYLSFPWSLSVWLPASFCRRHLQPSSWTCSWLWQALDNSPQPSSWICCYCPRETPFRTSETRPSGTHNGGAFSIGTCEKCACIIKTLWKHMRDVFQHKPFILLFRSCFFSAILCLKCVIKCMLSSSFA